MPRIQPAKMAGNHLIDTLAWCPGCGLHFEAVGEHRADCTETPPPCSECLYYPAVHGEHREGCRAK